MPSMLHPLTLRCANTSPPEVCTAASAVTSGAPHGATSCALHQRTATATINSNSQHGPSPGVPACLPAAAVP
jgi:hypothetical protein